MVVFYMCKCWKYRYVQKYCIQRYCTKVHLCNNSLYLSNCIKMHRTTFSTLYWHNLTVGVNLLFLLLTNLVIISFFPDYLNNLSPDAKEYEDTQGIVVSVSLTHNDDHWPCLNCEHIHFAYNCNFLSTAALVIVSGVADQVNDNLKQGVSCFCVRERVVLLIHDEKGARGYDVIIVNQVSRNKESSVKSARHRGISKYIHTVTDTETFCFYP